MKVCVGCVYEYDWTEPLTAIPEGCKGCKMVDGKPSNYKQKTQTNADRIRAMSDDLLATLIYGLCYEAYQYALEPSMKPIADTEDGWLEWLKQPAEVDKDA